MTKYSAGYALALPLYMAIFLLVLCALAQPSAATEQIQVFEVPTRPNWNLPLTFKFIPTTPLETSDITVKLLPSSTTSFDFTSGQCVVSVQTTDGKRTVYQIDEFESSDDNWTTAKVAFGTELSLSQLLFTCPQVMRLTSVRELSIAITDEASSFPEVVHRHFVAEGLSNAVAFFLRYYWRHDRPGIVSVEFTLYKPPGEIMIGYHIRHPLLYLNNITSMHLSPNENIQQDLAKLYNFSSYSSSSFTCKSPSNSNRTVFTNLEGFVFLEIDTELKPDDHYTCSFTIDYPADVVDYIFEHLSKGGFIRARHPLMTGADLRFSRPAHIPVKTTTNQATDDPRPLQLWRAPHHTSDIDHFEFGIAKSPYYIHQINGPLDIFEPFFDFSFQLDSQPTSPDLFKQIVDTVRCKSHHELEYTDEPKTWEAFKSIVINGNEFDVFGKTCKVTLSQRSFPQTSAKRDYYHIPHLAYTMDDPISGFRERTLPITKMNAFYEGSADKNAISHLIRDTSMVSSTRLPPITPITFSKGADDTGSTVIRGSMNVQFLLPSHPQDDQASSAVAFQFVFPQFMHQDDIIPHLGYRRSTIWITFGDHIIYQGEFKAYAGRGYFRSLSRTALINDVDPITTIFQQNRPFRSPTIDGVWTGPTNVDPAYPLTVTVEIPVRNSVPTNSDGSTVDVYPIAIPATSDEQYHPEYAVITPVRDTPLTGYSYRCVTWDKMAAPYVYGNGEPAITNENSKPCSDYYTEGIAVEVTNPNIWKQSAYFYHRGYVGETNPSCFYELAAVCVTPSATEDNQYDVHPLADCPSFLGEVHALPCSLVESGENGADNPTWGYELQLSQPQFEKIDGEPTISISWAYKGDPRLTVSIFAMAHPSSTNAGENVDAPEPILIATGVPSFLDSEVLQSKRYQLPFFGSQVTQIRITVVLESHPAVEEMNVIDYDPFLDIMERCNNETGKMVDETIHLCICQPGFISSKPHGLEDPFIHPNDFTCERRCPVGFTWVDDECQCDCQHGGVCIENEDEDEGGYQCACVDGYYGDICLYHGIDNLDPFCDELECVVEHTLAASITANENGEEDENEEDLHHTCKIVLDPDDATTLIQCNCHPAYAGDRCELDNPDYIHLCDEGFEWNPKTRQCEPDLPDDSVCHTFSETVLPPFFTNHCGYGVPSGANCEECTCLSRWVQDPTSDDKKCSRCKLEYGAPDEQCMKNGHTSEITYSPLLCWVGRCLCNAGYYGPKCQHKVMYGTLEFLKTLFTSLSTPSPSLSSDSTDTTTILTRNQLRELEVRVVGPISDALHAHDGLDIDNPVILHIQQATQTITIINNESDDNNENNGEDENQGDNDTRTEQQQQIMTTVVFAIQLPINDDSNDNTDRGNDNNEGSPFIQFNTLNENNESTSLYDAWEQLQNTEIPEDAELGVVKSVEPIYDPHCVPSEFVTCPDGQDNLLPPEQQVDADELEDIYVEDPIIDNSDNDGIDDDDDDDAETSSNSSHSHTTKFIYIIIGILASATLL